jgi:hypothetical protein
MEGNFALLRIAYVANIAILTPVCWSMFIGSGVAGVFGGVVENSDGLRLLVASIWLTILGASAVGLAQPQALRLLLLVQVAYKAIWLGSYIIPRIIAGSPVPTGIATVFALIVLTYPVIYWAAFRPPG